jgi:hypothetical protein
MYDCTCVRMLVCSVRVYVRIHVVICACMYVCMYVFMHACMYVWGVLPMDMGPHVHGEHSRWTCGPHAHGEYSPWTSTIGIGIPQCGGGLAQNCGLPMVFRNIANISKLNIRKLDVPDPWKLPATSTDQEIPESSKNQQIK